MSTELHNGGLLLPVEFDRVSMLPPDSVSETIGKYAFHGLWWNAFLSEGKVEESRLLIPGIGSAVIAAAVLSERDRLVRRGREYASFPLSIVCFDIDATSCEFAERNLSRYAQAVDGFTYEVFHGDWKNRDDMTRVEMNDFQGVVVNPPYLTKHERRNIRPGYETVPDHVLIDDTGDEFGLGQYPYLFELAQRALEVRPGAYFMGRFAANRHTAYWMREALTMRFADQVPRSRAHINVKSLHHNFTGYDGRRSYSVFAVEPKGMIFSDDGNPLNLYWAEEFIDQQFRDLVAENTAVSYSFSVGE